MRVFLKKIDNINNSNITIYTLQIPFCANSIQKIDNYSNLKMIQKLLVHL